MLSLDALRSSTLSRFAEAAAVRAPHLRPVPLPPKGPVSFAVHILLRNIKGIPSCFLAKCVLEAWGTNAKNHTCLGKSLFFVVAAFGGKANKPACS